jgi:CBS domain-containing protein
VFNIPVRKVMQKVLQAAPGVSVSKAAKLMAAKNVGAILVVEDDHLVGIFTERDVVFRVVAKGIDAQTTMLAEVMTRTPITVDPEKAFGYALVVMQENGFRHLPVIKDGRPVGIVSSRSAMDPDLEEFVSEIRRREYWKHSKGRPS